MRLTETFRDGFAADGSTHGSVWDLIADAEQRLLLNGVLEGRLLRVDLALPTATGSVTVQAEAVVDMAVTRHALLTVCSAAPDPGRRAGAEALLGDPSVDDSQAIVWIKDLDGRYLRVNRRYSEARRAVPRRCRRRQAPRRARGRRRRAGSARVHRGGGRGANGAHRAAVPGA